MYLERLYACNENRTDRRNPDPWLAQYTPLPSLLTV